MARRNPALWTAGPPRERTAHPERMTPDDRRRIRALRDAAILTSFYLLSQLVIVPLAGGHPAAEQLSPALFCGILLFAFAYLIRRAADRRRCDPD